MSSFEDQYLSQENRPWSRLIGMIAVWGTALAVSISGALFHAEEFWAGYLTAFVFWLGISLGCIATALLHLLTGGRWGTAVGRNLRAGAGTLVIGAVAIVPLLFGASFLYPGAQDSASSQLNSHQQQYFSLPMVAGRLVVAFTVWGALAGWILWSYCRQKAKNVSSPSPRKAALGLIAFWLTATMGIVDGMMSLTPGWTSSLFPLIEIVGFGIAALAFVIVIHGGESTNLRSDADRQQSHDLGNLLQAFNLVWVYLAFSQYLIIWSGDLPHEVTWYRDRGNPVLAGVTVTLVLLHFAVPFGLLLSRDLKRDARRLAKVAALLLAMRLVAVAWTILPETGTDSHWGWAVTMTLSNSIVLGGVWLTAFSAIQHRLPRHPPVPLPEQVLQNGKTAMKGAS